MTKNHRGKSAEMQDRRCTARRRRSSSGGGARSCATSTRASPGEPSSAGASTSGGHPVCTATGGKDD